MKKLIVCMLSLFALASCGHRTEPVPAIDLTDLDTSVAPGEDFFRYANGGWMAKNPLKAEFARYGSFDQLGELNQERLNELFQSMSSMRTRPGSVEQKLVDLYLQGLDSTRRNAEGCQPVMPYINQIQAAADKTELLGVMASFFRQGSSFFFDTYVHSDLADCNRQALYMDQSGLGIGDRDYYVDPANAALHQGYQAFLAQIFALCGLENASQMAANALSVEDRLAAFSWSSVQCRDVAAQYNPMSLKDLAERFPGFDFGAYLSAIGLSDVESVIVSQPSFFEGFARLYADTDLQVLKDYMLGQFIQGCCGSLSDDFYAASFDFFSRQMSGITEQRPRWKRAMAVPNSVLGEAVGKLYVDRYFPASSKKRMLTLVENLRVALGQHIDSLSWMTDSTKAYAREKLANFTVKIGYPDQWKDYSTLTVDPALSYLENRLAASAWYVRDNLSKLGKPTDKTEWHMTPQTVNAYYNPNTNEICFPAAILQPPFFNPDADDAVNYGAIGVVIGHEMTHGFDDQGRLFDKEGNMANWWTDADDAAFRELSQVLVRQYGEVEVLPGVFANGELSLGENIADHGGVSIAYTALHNALKGQEPAPIDGFTADQRFFLGFAHVWAANITDEEIARRTKLDVHSLSENRVNVTLRNFQQFFDAFGICEGDAMFRPESERVIIW